MAGIHLKHCWFQNFEDAKNPTGLDVLAWHTTRRYLRAWQQCFLLENCKAYLPDQDYLLNGKILDSWRKAASHPQFQLDCICVEDD